MTPVLGVTSLDHSNNEVYCCLVSVARFMIKIGHVMKWKLFLLLPDTNNSSASHLGIESALLLRLTASFPMICSAMKSYDNLNELCSHGKELTGWHVSLGKSVPFVARALPIFSNNNLVSKPWAHVVAE